MQNDFLVEIHTEELPPKSLRKLSEDFLEAVKTRVTKSDLTFTGTKIFATPRRLAVLLEGLSAQQPDKTIERKGPALDKAYDADGKPTQACLGFAKSAGVDVSQLIKLPGNFVGCKQDVKGKTVFEIMPTIVNEAVSSLPIPKPMRWGNHSEKFIRPVHSVLMMYGDKVIDAEILGKKTSNKTRGHRFLAPEWIEIISPNTYEKQLEKASVIADFKKREELIWQQSIELVKNKFGSKAILPKDAALLDEVTSLVEMPKAICGSFDAKFLNVPAEALISAMKDHQRYFPIVDANQKLLPNFITISNIDAGNEVIAGNERVLRARLSDAEFFYETDKKIKLADRIEKLKHIVFQNKLGTIFDKTERAKEIARYLAIHINADKEIVTKAAELSKTDLTTELVGEFPELQGLAGFYYAKEEGLPVQLAQALEEQYYPRFSGDKTPASKEGLSLALADRIDTIVGFFGINLKPTGEKDPFALRRCANGILQLLFELPARDVDLKDLLNYSSKIYKNSGINLEENVVPETLEYIIDRMKFDREVPAKIFNAVKELKLSNVFDMTERFTALEEFLKLPEAESLSAANKRVKNILVDAENITGNELSEALFESDAEKKLYKSLQEQEAFIHSLKNEADYKAILTHLARLKVPVDDFFDHVMVMTEDKAKRENRILMLKKLRELFLHVADIALLQ